MLLIPITIFFSLILFSKSSINPTGLFCSNPNQSPINIMDFQGKFIQEKYFRILFVNYNNIPKGNKWIINPTDQSIQLGNTTNYTLGSITIVKDYAIYQFNLNRILIRLPSEHKLNGNNMAAELQLIHTFNSNGSTLGRRILLKQNYLVVSIFFNVSDIITDSTTSLFKFTNLNDFLVNGNEGFLRDIKIRYLVNNMPGYLYEGSLTSGNCDPAIWILQSNYNYLTSNDYNNLISALKNISSTMTSNNRDIKGDSSTYTVYKNVNAAYNYGPSLINYNCGFILGVSKLLSLIVLVFYIIILK